MADHIDYPRGGIKPRAGAGWVYLCGHCEDPIGSGKYCRGCKTKAGRAEVDKLNQQINEKNYTDYGTRS